MKLKNVIVMTIAALMLMSFSSSKNETLIVGTYGNCGCDNSSDAERKFGISLNQDHTFHYFDYTNASGKIDITGNWNLNNNIISLSNYSGSAKIASRWKMEKSGRCIRARQGLEFIRICNVKECN